MKPLPWKPIYGPSLKTVIIIIQAQPSITMSLVENMGRPQTQSHGLQSETQPTPP